MDRRGRNLSGWPWFKRLDWQRLAIGLAGVALAIGLWMFLTPAAPVPARLQPPLAPRAVGALGRIEPLVRVVRLAPAAALEPARVEQLRVEEGERLQVGQVVAVLDNRERLEAALQVAGEKVQIAQARLAQVRAGAKAGEVAAQRATIARLNAELAGEIQARRAEIARLTAEWRFSLSERRRNALLSAEGAISASASDSRALAVDTARERLAEAEAAFDQNRRSREAQIREAQATLLRITEVRPVDVRLARAELDNALASARQARSELALAFVRTPKAGRVLKIHTRAGERVGERGIAEVGDTDRMAVVAEVYQSDISRVRVGQQATITGEGFTGELEGDVVRVGLSVSAQSVLASRPGADSDRKVVEVRVRLTPASSRRAAGLTNHQVEARIRL